MGSKKEAGKHQALSVKKVYKPSLAWLGAGAMATSLALSFEQAQCFTRAVYARRQEQAAQLCGKLQKACVLPSLDFSRVACDLVFVAVADDAIADVVRAGIFPSDVCLVHSSASVSLAALRTHKGPCGVFYPLQTFSMQTRSSMQGVYVCIEGSDPEVTAQLVALAETLGGHPCVLEEKERQYVHVAAVLAHNFSNYLLGGAQTWMREKKLPFKALQPLMRTMLDHAFTLGPIPSQSGPARRGDMNTIAQHLRLLEKMPGWKALYEKMTTSLGKSYGHPWE